MIFVGAVLCFLFEPFFRSSFTFFCGWSFRSKAEAKTSLAPDWISEAFAVASGLRTLEDDGYRVEHLLHQVMVRSLRENKGPDKKGDWIQSSVCSSASPE